jgi:glycine cleavage system transcriptional repressor
LTAGAYPVGSGQRRRTIRRDPITTDAMADSPISILVAHGSDRPGVLDEISMFLAERGMNIIESRVSMLRGQFALLLLLRGQQSDFERIAGDLPTLIEQVGVQVALRPAGEAETRDVTHMRLRARGANSTEAVLKLSHLMRVLSTNIDNIETDTRAMPDGQTRFELEMELSVPRHTPLVMLKQYVESLAQETGIQCEFDG